MSLSARPDFRGPAEEQLEMRTKKTRQPSLALLREELEIEGGRLLLGAIEMPASGAAGDQVTSFEAELAWGLGTEERAQLADIKDALDRIETGLYGQCDRCGARINANELALRPWASECADCRTRNRTILKSKRSAQRARTLVA